MPNPDDKNKTPPVGAGSTPPANTPPAGGGATPPAPGAAGGATSQAGATPPAGNGSESAQQPPAPGAANNGGTTPGSTPPAAGSGDKPPAANPPAPPPSPGKNARMKCVAMKGQKIVVGKEIVTVDENGFFEVEEKEAARLLTIPGYEKA